MAIPIRTSSGSLPSSGSRSIARIASAASDARTGVVVVGDGPAEDREHGVTDELLARALEAFDRVGHPAQRGADPRPDLLGSCSAIIRT